MWLRRDVLQSSNTRTSFGHSSRLASLGGVCSGAAVLLRGVVTPFMGPAQNMMVSLTLNDAANLCGSAGTHLQTAKLARRLVDLLQEFLQSKLQTRRPRKTSTVPPANSRNCATASSQPECASVSGADASANAAANAVSSMGSACLPGKASVNSCIWQKHERPRKQHVRTNEPSLALLIVSDGRRRLAGATAGAAAAVQQMIRQADMLGVLGRWKT